MKTIHKITFALATGVAAGGALVQGLQAQVTTPTYVVIDISKITDAEGFKTLGPKAGPSVAAFGGKTIIRTENFTTLDGAVPARFVVIAFDSLANAKAWYASPAQKEVDALRTKTTISREFFVESVDRGMPK